MIKTIVDIGILNYNHEAFIEKCIQSVLEQECNFGFNIHIIDDCSSDNSFKIIAAYTEKYPDIITSSRNTTNQGVAIVISELLNISKSKYICALDGDDCWSNKHKLQHQIDFLESNPNYAGCFHDAKIISSIETDGNKMNHQSPKIYKTYSQFNNYKSDIYPQDIIKRTIIPTASLVFRNKPLLHIVNAQKDFLSLYWAMQLEIIKDSKFKYFNECWSVYNDHENGMSKKYGLLRFKEQNISILKNLLTDNYYKFQKSSIYESISNEYYNILWTLRDKGEKRELRKYIKAYHHYYKLAGKHIVRDFKAKTK
jgi:glycosyltransferase involved in cell wall biosynthesis